MRPHSARRTDRRTEPGAAPSAAKQRQSARGQRAPSSSGLAEPGPRYRYIGDEVRRHLENEVVRLTNEVRAEHGLRPVQSSEILRRSARAHSEDMLTRRYFDHVNPNGWTPFDRMRAHGHPRPAAENIAHGQQTPEEAIQAWLRSPGHRANLLLANARQLGVGLRDGYWTQNFGY